MSERIHLSLDKDAQATLNNLESIINNRYDGNKSKFFRDMLMNYDDHSRLQAKKEMIEQRIQRLKTEVEDLELEKKAIEQEIEDTQPSKQEDEDQSKPQTLDNEYWDKTVRMIFVRTGPEDYDSVEARYEEWVDGRRKVFNNRASHQISYKEFLDKLLSKARERGYEDKADKLEESVKKESVAK